MTNYNNIYRGVAIGLDGALATFFVVWGAAVAISLPPFAFESRRSIRNGVCIAIHVLYFRWLKIINKIKK